MKAGVDRSGAAKGEGEDKNASEKASPGVEKIKIKIADPPTLSRIPAPHRQVTCFAPDNFGFRAPIEMRKWGSHGCVGTDYEGWLSAMDT